MELAEYVNIVVILIFYTQRCGRAVVRAFTECKEG